MNESSKYKKIDIVLINLLVAHGIQMRIKSTQ